MKVIKIIFTISASMFATNALAWEAKVTKILHHHTVAAIYLSPDPGVGQCTHGQPYILTLDGSSASKERFSMLLAALTAGQTVGGYSDGCSTAIWGNSRPLITRLSIEID